MKTGDFPCVSELIEQLKTMPQDARVFLSGDAEGNGYNALHYIALQLKSRRESDYGAMVYGDLAEFEALNGPDEDGHEQVVAMWPV